MVTQSNINLGGTPNNKKQTNSASQGSRVFKHRRDIQGKVFRPYLH